jgi:tRNA A-37 threonylcarbamoyl transferase component Bud32
MEALAPNRPLSGRYVLQETIASGGMATVWRAHDEVLARSVAIKILHPELARDPDFAQRFHHEAVAAARLTNPNIISVYDTGIDDDIYFIVMEYFAGTTLARMMRRGPLDPERAVGLISPVLSALAFAHREGLVHRDVKPANILVSQDGRVKVTDFGIAKAAFARGDLTTTGQVLGTVRYLSPEQVQGSEVDARSDLYSVGVVLYEMVTGRPPFQAENDVATAMMRLTRQPLPPRAIRAGIPRALDAAITKAMARNPDERYPSAEAMLAALQAAGRGRDSTPPGGLPAVTEPTIVTSSESVFRSWMLVPLVIVVVAAATIGAVVALGRLKLGGPLGVRPAPQQSQATQGHAATIPIVSARDFDPEGDGSEHPGDVPLAFDGNAGTEWKTAHYNSEAFGNLKSGVGLWLEFGKAAKVSSVTISSSVPGWTFELKSGQSPEQASGPIADASGRTSFRTGADGRVTVTLSPATARGLLIWITALGSDDGRFAAAVSEVTVSGTS